MSDFLLTPSEVRELTGRVRRSTQVQTLRSMGIEHRIRPDGSIVILRAHAERVLSGDTHVSARDSESKPNWSAI